MWRPLAGCLLFVAALGRPALAEVANITGNELYQDCQSQTPICLRYLVAFDNTMSALVKSGFMVRSPLCPGPGATMSQDRIVFLHYAEKNPAQMNRPAADVLLASQLDAYPCNQPGR